MPAWSEMCSNGTEGSAWRAKKVVRKRLRRVDQRAGEYISWGTGSKTDQQPKGSLRELIGLTDSVRRTRRVWRVCQEGHGAAELLHRRDGAGGRLSLGRGLDRSRR